MTGLDPSVVFSDGDDLEELPEGYTFEVTDPDGETTVIETAETSVFAFIGESSVVDLSGNAETVTSYHLQFNSE